MKNTDICKLERMIDSITELFSASCEFSHGTVAKNKHKQTVCCQVWSDVRSPFFTQRTQKRFLQTSRPFFGMLLTFCCLSTSCSALPDKLRIGMNYAMTHVYVNTRLTPVFILISYTRRYMAVQSGSLLRVLMMTVI